MPMSNNLQTADWKSEKHVPVIECPDTVKPNELFEVKVGVGKAQDHPNVTEHHIAWIRVFFRPDGDKYAYDVGYFAFNAHGAAVAGANKGPVYTHYQASFKMKVTAGGTLHAVSCCNIHGLWESERKLAAK